MNPDAPSVEALKIEALKMQARMEQADRPRIRAIKEAEALSDRMHNKTIPLALQNHLGVEALDNLLRLTTIKQLVNIEAALNNPDCIRAIQNNTVSIQDLADTSPEDQNQYIEDSTRSSRQTFGF